MLAFSDNKNDSNDDCSELFMLSSDDNLQDFYNMM